MYFADNWPDMRSFIERINDNDSNLVLRRARDAAFNPRIVPDLDFILDSLKVIPSVVRILKTRGLALSTTTTYHAFNAVLIQLDELEDPKFSDKLRAPLQSNKSISIILELVLVLSEIEEGNATCTTSLNHSADELKALSWAPLAIISDAEKSSSIKRRRRKF